MALIKKDLRKINDYLWEIPKSYRPDMKVPARIYISEKMLGQLEEEAINQIINVATLPGVVKYSLAMPDAHTGYGFVIGGVAATKFPEGVISPGGVGYDQNCLPAHTRILCDLGYFREIKEFKQDWGSQDIKIFEGKTQKIAKASILRFLELKSLNLYKITTKRGQEIKATKDHPLLTPYGMRITESLSIGDKIAVYPFEGVSYNRPSDEIIVSEKDIKKILLSLDRKPGTPKFKIIIQKLRKRNLLPLTYNHPRLPYILKIMGFIFGDGSMNFIGKRGDGIVYFCGTPEDLEEARKDVRKIGYTPSPIHYRKRKLKKGKVTEEYSFVVNAASLVILLKTLGVPQGSKVNQPFRIPKWIFKCPLWQKRLFLASLFGSELRCPHRRLDRRGNFNAPSFPVRKRIELLDNARAYLKDIKKLLKEFKVKVLYIEQPKNKEHINTKGKISWGLNLVISPAMENLLNLWGKIGFEYNKGRSFFANVAIQYLKVKQRVLKEKEEVIKFTIPRLLKLGLSYQKIANQLATGNPLTKRFIIDVCWKLNKGVRQIKPKIPANFPLFKDYLRETTKGLGQSGIVWDEIVKIEKITHKDFVYDFTVNHPDHNFIANGFVVSNCGVRLLLSDYQEKDIRPYLGKLAVEIQKEVPSGLGRGRAIKLSIDQINKILERGVSYLVEQGYGEKEDLENCEEKGKMEEADASCVSETAKNRGRDQVGTLGSGNHFCQLDKVEEIFDKEIAKTLGLFKNQVVVMVHTGSRGLGHQNCTDYLRIVMPVYSKYGIELPDRELACVPFNSPEGQNFFKALNAACNYAWANRQMITFYVRKAWRNILGRKVKLQLLYDVAHNIAKIEEHEVDGQKMKLVVHRKGATRAFPAGHPEIPEKYQLVGQPVLIPGSMGTASYVLVGTEKSKEAWHTVCHGSGRTMSRHEAIRQMSGQQVIKDLEKKGIIVKCASFKGIAEEAPNAYKNINEVVEVVHQAGLSRKVAKLVPLAVIKGE